MHYLLLLLAAVIWGGNAVVTKAAAGVIGPAEIGFWRWVFAVVLMAPFVARGLVANRAVLARHWWRLGVLGLVGGAGFSTLAYVAGSHTTALNIGIIQALMPLMSLGLAIILLGGRLTAGAVTGGVVSLIGVAAVITHGRPMLLFSQPPNPGDALMLLAVIGYAVYSVLLKHWQIGLPALQSLFVQNIAATLVLMPLWLVMPRHGLDAGNIGLVLYAAGLASIIAPLAWMSGIARIGPARAAMFFNLIPVVTAILAITLLGEHLDTALVIGGALTVGGVVLAERWKTPLGRRPPPD